MEWHLPREVFWGLMRMGLTLGGGKDVLVSGQQGFQAEGMCEPGGCHGDGLREAGVWGWGWRGVAAPTGMCHMRVAWSMPMVQSWGPHNPSLSS